MTEKEFKEYKILKMKNELSTELKKTDSNNKKLKI
jgi:hypothetical protein